MSTQTDKYYERYWAKDERPWSPIGVTLTPSERALIERAIPKGVRVLDFGCGDGSHLGPYIRGSGRTYIGVDISEAGVALCHEKGLEAYVLDAGKIPSGIAGVGAAVSFEVLEHLLEPQAAAEDIANALTPGGSFIGSVPNAMFVNNRIFAVFGIFSPDGDPSVSRLRPWLDPHIRFYTKRTLARLLAAAGFRSVRVEGGPFSLTDLPVVYRVAALRAVARVFDPLVGWLGRVAPSLFSRRLYFRCVRA